MKYLSVCSGIEAATAAWHPLGWQPVAFSEIEPFPAAVLAHHYPTIPNLGNLTDFATWPDYAIDILVGGTPCQSFSNAGLRKGLDDPRGHLMLTFGAVAARYRPRWVVWENVPGVLSSGDGCDFASLLGLLSGQKVHVPEEGWQSAGIVPGIASAYGVAWRVLDAQYFGLAQRRRRVFVIGCAGDWRRAAAVLFERESLRGDPAPSRGEREGVARTITAGARKSDRGEPGNLICVATGQAGAETLIDQAPTLNCNHEQPYIAYSFKPSHFTRGKDGAPSCIASPLSADADKGDQEPLVFQTLIARNGRGQLESVVPALAGADAGATSDMRPCVFTGDIVRRLTPRECERLQGFPDDYTLIPFKGKPAVDSPRYKALGNSMARPVMEWLGRQIQAVNEVLQ